MKTTFIGHASILVETNGLKILSDPWWEGPCFGTQWWVYPRPDTSSLTDQKIDYIYISHGHHDHLHLGTLRRLPKDAVLLVSDELDIKPFLEEQGFKVQALSRDQEFDLGQGVTCRIRQTCNDDTMMSLSDGQNVLLNLNDAMHAAPQPVQREMISWLKQHYDHFDYVFCGYGVASHFPNCYVLPNIDQAATASKRQAYFNRQWVGIVEQLNPRFAFPFAADVALLEEELIWSNEPVHNSERPTDVFNENYPNSTVKAIDIAPGFVIEEDNVIVEKLFSPVSLEKLKQDYAKEYDVANRNPKNSEAGLNSLVEILQENVKLCHAYLSEFSGNYKFLIILKGDDIAISITKEKSDINVQKVTLTEQLKEQYDLSLTLRYSYLRRCLTTQHGHEVLYVGSGCLFEYRDAKDVERDLHYELRMIIRHHENNPRSRFGDQPKWLFMLKNKIKQILGKKNEGLYDLKKWVVTK